MNEERFYKLKNRPLTKDRGVSKTRKGNYEPDAEWLATIGAIALSLLLIVSMISMMYVQRYQGVYKVLKSQAEYDYPAIKMAGDRNLPLWNFKSMTYYNTRISEKKKGNPIEFKKEFLDEVTGNISVKQMESFLVIGEGSEIVEERKVKFRELRDMLPPTIGTVMLKMDDYDLTDTNNIIVTAFIPTGEVISVKIGNEIEILEHLVWGWEDVKK